MIAAERAPDAAGVNVTLTEQCPAAATEAPHVLVTAKSAAFVPVAAMDVMVSAELPLLVSVTACAVLASQQPAQQTSGWRRKASRWAAAARCQKG